MEGNFFTTKLHDVILANKPDRPLKEAKGVFLVMDYVQDNLKQMLDTISPSDFHEDHIKVIMYNILCSLNFIGSANIMHRDIKPQNILIDSNCLVTLCDFGLGRTIPNYDKKDAADIPVRLKGEAGPDSDTEDTTPHTSEEI